MVPDLDDAQDFDLAELIQLCFSFSSRCASSSFLRLVLRVLPVLLCKSAHAFDRALERRLAALASLALASRRLLGRWSRSASASSLLCVDI